MGLQVWLPLNGTLENKGCSGINITSANPVFVNGGKLGKCYYNEYEKSIVTDPIEIGDEFSICYWVKYNSLEYPRTHVGIQHSNGSYAGGAARKGWDIGHGPSGGGTYNFDINDGTNVQRTYFSGISGLTDLNVWKHFTFTCSLSNMEIKLYINGVLAGTRQIDSNIGSFKTVYPLSINYIYGWYLDGYLNDFRVYDNVLSEKEIYDISKCLVIHYPLDDPYLEPTINLVPNSDTFSGYLPYTNGYTSIENCEIGNKKIVINNKGTWCGAYVSITLPHPGTYTISAYCKPISRSSTSVRQTVYTSGGGISDVDVWASWDNPGTWQRISMTRTYTTTNIILYLIAYGGTRGTDVVSCEYAMPQIEEKDHVTPYTPSSRTGELIYDGSGYGNNGTTSGELIIDDNSARYKKSVYFNNGITDNITAPITLGSDSITMSIWVKSKNGITGLGSYHIPFCISAAAFEFSISPAGRFRQGFYINGSRIVGDYGPDIISDKTWHMISATFDGIDIKRYVDGVLVNITNAPGTLSGGDHMLYLGRYGTSTSYGDKELYKSDVRIYETALSADDIKELYDTAAYIYNNGNLSGYEISETSDNLLRYENILMYTNESNTSVTRGKYTTRNGDLAMAFQATDTYFGSSDERNGKLLYGFFKENTQYVFDLWIDVDDIIWQDENRMGAFTIIYTDGTTSTEFNLVGSSNPKTGWQHKVVVTPAGKTVRSLSIFYFVSSVFYVRADSYIVELSETNISKNGVITSGQFIENTDTAFIGKATFNANQILEI